MKKNNLFAKTLKDCVTPILSPVFRKHGLEAKIVSDWESIVGKEIASYTAPASIRFPKGKNNGGTLTILCENSFSLQLQYQGPLIIEKLAVYFGYHAIERITISQTLCATPENKKSTPPKINKKIEETGDDLKDALNRLAGHLGV